MQYPAFLLLRPPAYSVPSGYETLTLAPGFNFVGLRLTESAVVSGTFTSTTSDSVTDSNADFSALDSAKTFILELGGAGALSGMIMEVPGSAFSGGSITGLTGVTDDYLAPYAIKPAQTLGGVFGSGSTAILTKGTLATGDTVYVPNGAGGFTTYYHSADTELFPGGPTVAGKWEKPGSGDDQANTPLNYLDGFYVQVRGSLVNLVVTGQVKTNATLIPAIEGFSYFSSIYPAGDDVK